MRSELRAVLSAVLMLALASTGQAQQGRVVERVLAVVGDTPVLLSDVRLLSALRGLSEAEALEAAIDERLMFQEAERLSQAALPEKEAQAAYLSLLAGLPPGADFPEAGLKRVARRQATILKYVDFRFLPQVRVTDEDVRAAYAQEPTGEPAPSFEERAPLLREKLERQALDERIEAWVRELRGAARIRRNAPE
jgi:hypothetical protein